MKTFEGRVKKHIRNTGHRVLIEITFLYNTNAPNQGLSPSALIYQATDIDSDPQEIIGGKPQRWENIIGPLSSQLRPFNMTDVLHKWQFDLKSGKTRLVMPYWARSITNEERRPLTVID